MISNKKETCKDIENELKGYEKRGVELSLQGRPSDPFRIARAISRVSESTASYMRDYITDDDGNLKQIDFCKIKNR